MNNKQSVTKRFVTLYIISAVLTCAAAAVSFIFIREIGAIHFILIGLAVISIIIAVYGIVSLKSAVVRPLSRIVGALKQLLGGQPDPNFIVKDASGEFIELSDLVRRALQRMYGDIELLGKVRNGDYSFDFESVHEEDGLIFALSGMIDRQRKLVSGLKMVSNQITIASGEIEGGSQSLASGSNQQALAVEQFRASVESLSIKASDNAASAREAIEAIQANTKIVDDIANDLKIMTKTMNDIDESAKRISKVSDVIENIAFQTNILALNAAVEAARAGQHGKGFAVVADEVRDLSNKSAEAARETAELIRADLANVEIGNKIAENAVTGMENISNLSAQNEERMVALTESSIAQSNSIKEISDGISQISQIIQSNAALAEQSAAASTELTTQAAELDKLVEVYKLKE